jgi:hypothetical protein
MGFSFRDNMPPVKLNRNEYFIMGDNFDNSFDSRVFGPISGKLIEGKIIYKKSLSKTNKGAKDDQSSYNAGGEGTRLRPLTCIRAKPMVPVINRPTIEHTVRLLKSYGIIDITLSIYTLPENFQNYFGVGSDFGVKITYSVEEKPLGTAGGVKKAIGDKRDSYILSGDGIY